MSDQTVYFVTGATQGLGYEFVRQLRERPGAIVFATSRDPDRATRLSSLTDKGNVHIVKITEQPEQVNEALAAAEMVKKVAGKVDVVIANAGIIHHETSIADSSMDMYQQFLNVNLLNNIAIQGTPTPYAGIGSARWHSQACRHQHPIWFPHHGGGFAGTVISVRDLESCIEHVHQAYRVRREEERDCGISYAPWRRCD